MISRDFIYELQKKYDQIFEFNYNLEKVIPYTQREKTVQKLYKKFLEQYKEYLNLVNTHELKDNKLILLVSIRNLIETSIDIFNLKKVPQYEEYLHYIGRNNKIKFMKNYVDDYNTKLRRITRNGQDPNKKLFTNPLDVDYPNKLQTLITERRTDGNISEKFWLLNKYCEKTNIELFETRRGGNLFIKDYVNFKFLLALIGTPYVDAPKNENELEISLTTNLFNLRNSKYQIIYNVASRYLHNEHDFNESEILTEESFNWCLSSLLRKTSEYVYDIFKIEIPHELL